MTQPLLKRPLLDYRLASNLSFGKVLKWVVASQLQDSWMTLII